MAGLVDTGVDKGATAKIGIVGDDVTDVTDQGLSTFPTIKRNYFKTTDYTTRTTTDSTSANTSDTDRSFITRKIRFR